MTVSIIIPVFNEEGVVGNTIRYLRSIVTENEAEIIVVDGGSNDDTLAEARLENVRVVQSPKKGRAAQMNCGARLAKTPVLYFLHADSLPPGSLIEDIKGSVSMGYHLGCYRLRFDANHWFLKANAWFTRFDVDAFRFGDQSLFVTKNLFDRVGGFCESHIVMEDQEIIKRLRRHGKFTILTGELTTSARKYIANGVYKMQSIFFLIYFMYKLGYSQEKLRNTYRKLIKQDKL